MNSKTKVAVGGIAGAAAALLALMMIQEPDPLPLFAYEGDTVAGVDIPPRVYVEVEENAHAEGVEILPSPCKPGWWNVPCYVDAGTTRLRAFRCLDWKDPNVVEFPKPDQKSCEIQKGFNSKLNIPAKRE